MDWIEKVKYVELQCKSTIMAMEIPTMIKCVGFVIL